MMLSNLRKCHLPLATVQTINYRLTCGRPTRGRKQFPDGARVKRQSVCGFPSGRFGGRLNRPRPPE
ncbi:hypothetical protein SCOCK_220070 [Actinacidiphila cocklensis]|uniref:Uncharacterized protein n=1 Tax=Actinacidiphila cocklensis TaxID=887465 RepID=A0A9W4E6A5_9ACTN|nr:hypothetical protein SCOCK_220070 [Actinacidiphila cocklensis]